jgi:hypothetical protein
MGEKLQACECSMNVPRIQELSPWIMKGLRISGRLSWVFPARRPPRIFSGFAGEIHHPVTFFVYAAREFGWRNGSTSSLQSRIPKRRAKL